MGFILTIAGYGCGAYGVDKLVFEVSAQRVEVSELRVAFGGFWAFALNLGSDLSGVLVWQWLLGYRDIPLVMTVTLPQP